MSVCIAMRHNGDMWIASDGQATYGNTKIDCGEKWVKWSDWAVLVTGKIVHLDLMRDYVKTLTPDYRLATHTNVSHFARKYFQWAVENNPTPLMSDGHFDVKLLVATPTDIYSVGGNADVVTIKDPYFAAGSGDEIALGVLYAMHKHRSAPHILKVALSAAIKYADGCGPGMYIEKLNACEG